MQLYKKILISEIDCDILRQYIYVEVYTQGFFYINQLDVMIIHREKNVGKKILIKKKSIRRSCNTVIAAFISTKRARENKCEHASI